MVIKDSGVKQSRDSGWLGSDLRWTVTNLESARHLVLEGLGFSWIPLHEACEYIQKGQLLPLDLEENYQKNGSLYLVFANKSIAGPATQLLASYIKTCTQAYIKQQLSLDELRDSSLNTED